MSRSLINSKSATSSPATGCDLDILSGGGTFCRNLSRRFVMKNESKVISFGNVIFDMPAGMKVTKEQIGKSILNCLDAAQLRAERRELANFNAYAKRKAAKKAGR
jgi:hypothetical protein